MGDTPERRLIRTTYRGPISRELSYPVGAEIVSSALAGVPQYDVLGLTFHGSRTPTEMRKRIASGTNIELFQADYLRPRWRWVNNVTEDWSLTVYPVPRQHKAQARRLLIEDGLIRVRSWLSTGAAVVPIRPGVVVEEPTPAAQVLGRRAGAAGAVASGTMRHRLGVRVSAGVRWRSRHRSPWLMVTSPLTGRPAPRDGRQVVCFVAACARNPSRAGTIRSPPGRSP